MKNREMITIDQALTPDTLNFIFSQLLILDLSSLRLVSNQFHSLIENFFESVYCKGKIKDKLIDMLLYIIFNPKQAQYCFHRIEENGLNLQYNKKKYANNSSKIEDKDLPKIIFDALTTKKITDENLKLFRCGFKQLAKAYPNNENLTRLQAFYDSARIHERCQGSIIFKFSCIKSFVGKLFLNIPDLLIGTHTSNLDLSYSMLKNIFINGVPLKNINFSFADLEGSIFGATHRITKKSIISVSDNVVQYRDCQFQSAILDKSKFILINANNMNFIAASLDKVKLIRCTFSNADFSYANLRNTCWKLTRFVNCNFKNAQFDKARNIIIQINLEVERDENRPFQFIEFNSIGDGKKIKNLGSVEIYYEMLFGLHVARSIPFFNTTDKKILRRFIVFLERYLDDCAQKQVAVKFFEDNVAEWIKENSRLLKKHSTVKNFLIYLSENLKKWLPVNWYEQQFQLIKKYQEEKAALEESAKTITQLKGQVKNIELEFQAITQEIQELREKQKRTTHTENLHFFSAGQSFSPSPSISFSEKMPHIAPEKLVDMDITNSEEIAQIELFSKIEFVPTTPFAESFGLFSKNKTVSLPPVIESPFCLNRQEGESAQDFINNNFLLDIVENVSTDDSDEYEHKNKKRRIGQ